MQTHNAPPSQPKRSWWSRHWKWVVPTGCLLPILGCGGCFTGIIWLGLSIIKSSDVYQQSLVTARSHPQVQAALGSPIEPAWWVMGEIKTHNASGQASLVYDISGPLDSATVHAEGESISGQWALTDLVVDIHSTGQRLDLINGP